MGRPKLEQQSNQVLRRDWGEATGGMVGLQARRKGHGTDSGWGTFRGDFAQEAEDKSLQEAKACLSSEGEGIRCVLHKAYLSGGRQKLQKVACD